MRRHLAFTSTALALGILLGVLGQVRAADPAGRLATPMLRPAGVSPSDLTDAQHGFETISFANASVGCAAGNGAIVCTADGGRHWRTAYAGSAHILRLRFTTPAVGWAVAPSLLLATADGGRTWTRRAILPGLQSVDFVSARDGWAVTTRGLFVTHAGGARWTFAPTPVPPRANAVSFVDSQTGWMVGAGADGNQFQVLRTTTGGRAWTRQWTAPVGDVWPLGHAQLLFTSATAGWALLTAGQGCASQEPYVLYHTADGGGHWRAILAGGGACGGPGYPRRLAYPGPDGYPGPLAAHGPLAWVVSASPGSGTEEVAATRDDGRTWTYARSIPTNAVLPIVAADVVDARRGWVATGAEVEHRVVAADGTVRFNEGGRVLYTADGGHSWVAQASI